MTTYTKPTVKLTGTDGNIFAIMGVVCKAMRKAGATREQVDAYQKDVFACQSYDEALTVTCMTVDVE